MKKICGFYCCETEVPPILESKLKKKMEYLIRHKDVRRFLVNYRPNDFFLFVLRSLKELKQKYRFLAIYLTVNPWHLQHFTDTGLMPDFLPYLNVEDEYSSYQYWSDWEPNYIIVFDPFDYETVKDVLLPPSFPFSDPIYLEK